MARVRTKRLLTRRERLAKPWEHTQQQPLDSFLGLHKPRAVPNRLQFVTRESANTRFRISSFSKPDISLLEPVEALIFSPNVSKVDVGVHGHQTIVLLQPYICTVDRGPPPEAVHACAHTTNATCPRTPSFKPFCFSSACCTEAVGIAHKPPRCL